MGPCGVSDEGDDEVRDVSVKMRGEEQLQQSEEVFGVIHDFESYFSSQKSKEKRTLGGRSPCGQLSLIHSCEGIRVIGKGIPSAS